jgi:predicted DNA-binding protein with PD1-like motif
LKAETSERARHIVLRGDVGEVLPDALLRALREHRVAGGWLRGNGVLSEIDLRAYGSDIGGHGAGRRVAGPAQVLVLDGTIGIADGDVSLGLRGVFARETDRGLETIAGEITSARVVALEVVVTALDDIVLPRGIDADAGIWLLSQAAGGALPAAAPSNPDTPRTPPPFERPANQGYPQTPGPAPAVRAPNPAWSEAVSASVAATSKDKPGEKPARPLQPIPFRPRANDGNEDGLFPVAGDFVEHFAFGTCEVLRSDGDRLHLKVGKDGRIREIALEMLKVTLLTSDGETQRYRLDRKM